MSEKRMTRAEYLAADEEDWETIRALLLAGCSMPIDLERKYQAHMRDTQQMLARSVR